MWGCEFREERLKNEALDSFVNSLHIQSIKPLSPRDSFYGGRVECLKTFHTVNEAVEEKIYYSDICSLYPFVNKYGRYPVGHPTIFVGEEECSKNGIKVTSTLENLEGFIKCSIIPPKELYHPVLPMKINSKCMFVLCQKCARDMVVTPCQHTDEERTLTATWVICEVRLALEHGYKIANIYEVWTFETTQYDRDTDTGGGLFTEYVNKFLKIKQESSGWPDFCKDDAALQDRYIEDYKEREGIQLERDKIADNPGLRSVAKLQLNSLWGRFGMRDDLAQTKLISKYDELIGYFTNPNIEVVSSVPINDEIMCISYKNTAENIKPCPTTNVFIAAFTTALARIHLYKYLSKLGRRVLYSDTDSVIYTHIPGEWMPEHVDYLGCMTDELERFGTGSYIDCFVSGGPKNYAFRVRGGGDSSNTSTVCKAKGITINFSNKDVVNFESLYRMCTEYTDPVVITYPNRIIRLKHWRVATCSTTKTYQPVYLKRKFDDIGLSEPFGSSKKLKCL